MKRCKTLAAGRAHQHIVDRCHPIFCRSARHGGCHPYRQLWSCWRSRLRLAFSGWPSGRSSGGHFCESAPPYSDVFWTVGEGYLLNNFLPFRLGRDWTRFFAQPQIGHAIHGDFADHRHRACRWIWAFPRSILLAALPFVVGAEGAGQIGVIVGVIVIDWCLSFYISWRVTINGHWISSINSARAGLLCNDSAEASSSPSLQA